MATPSEAVAALTAQNAALTAAVTNSLATSAVNAATAAQAVIDDGMADIDAGVAAAAAQVSAAAAQAAAAATSAGNAAATLAGALTKTEALSAEGVKKIGLSLSSNPSPAFLKVLSDMLNGLPIPVEVFLPNERVSAIRGFSSTWGAQTALQDAVNVMLYEGRSSLLTLGNGLFNLEDTLQLGYGESYKQITLEGKGSAYKASPGFNGTILQSRQSDRPGVNFQGGRRPRLRKVALGGMAGAFIEANLLGSAECLVDDTLLSAWVDPALHANAGGRYTPYAAISIDGYSGVQPSPSYPAIPYPSGLGLSQYNKNPSSNVELDDVFIYGFYVGLAIQPSNFDGNGDFVSLYNTVIQSCVMGLSAGNSQGRCVNMYGGEIAQCHTAFTNNKHGKQIGKFGGKISGTSFGRVIQLLDIAASFSGPMVFDGCVAELLWRLGSTGAAGSATYPIVSSDSEWNLTGGSAIRGRPAQIATGGTAITLRGGTVRADSANTGNLKLEGVQLAITDVAARDASQRVTGSILPLGSAIVDDRPTSARINTAAGAVELSEYAKTAGRTRPISRIARKTVWSENAIDVPGVDNPRLVVSTAKANGTLAITGLAGTIDFTAASGVLPFKISAGDLIQDDQTGTLFLVESMAALVATVRALNNYQNVGAGNVLRDPVVAGGNWYLINCRLYGTTYPLFGDVTSGSPTIANIGRGDAFATFAGTDIAVGDYLWQNAWLQRFFPNGVTVTAIDTTAKTITMSANATKTQAAMLLPLWVKA